MAGTTAAGLILNTLRFNRNITPPLFSGVEDATMTAQPSGIVNHAAWQVGHIAVTLHQGARLLGASLELPADWEPKFGMGSKVVADRGAYPSKAELLGMLARVSEAFEAALSAADDATLAKPTPDAKFRVIVPTVADVALFVAGTHYGYHLGQVSAWRRAQGLPSALGV